MTNVFTPEEESLVECFETVLAPLAVSKRQERSGEKKKKKMKKGRKKGKREKEDDEIRSFSFSTISSRTGKELSNSKDGEAIDGEIGDDY